MRTDHIPLMHASYLLEQLQQTQQFKVVLQGPQHIVLQVNFFFPYPSVMQNPDKRKNRGIWT